jgi:multiple sugar transport system permease protein
MKMKKPRKLDPFVICMIFPAIAAIGFVSMYPVAKLFHLSTLEWFLTKPLLIKFVGLSNFKNLFMSDIFYHALSITFIYLGIAVSCELVIGLFVAHRLIKIEQGKILFVTFILIPMVMSPVIVGLFWRAWSAPGFGLIGYFMKLLKLGSLVPPEGFTGTHRTALPMVIFVDIWEWTPFMVLIIYAGLQSLPSEPFEAIAIDGANSWQTFTKLTLPMLKPVILVALLFRIIDAYRAFDVIWIMTWGGPGRSTENLSIFTYKLNFREWNVGLSATSGIVMLVVTLIISLILINRLSSELGA